MSADSALDTVYWIESAWQAVTEATIRNTFRSAGFESSNLAPLSTSMNLLPIESDCIEELERILNHVTIGGQTISAYEYVVRPP